MGKEFCAIVAQIQEAGRRKQEAVRMKVGGCRRDAEKYSYRRWRDVRKRQLCDSQEGCADAMPFLQPASCLLSYDAALLVL